MDNTELVALAQAGDDAAFSHLVERHQRFLHKLLTVYLGPQEAADVAQECWITVHQKLWQLEAQSKFRPWLRQLVFYQAVHYRKRRARTRTRELLLAPEDWRRLAEYVADSGGRLEDLMNRTELRRQVGRELDALPGQYGLILRLRYMNGLTYEEIVRLTGTPLSSVKWR